MEISNGATKATEAMILPLIIDEYARNSPTKPWASVPKTSDFADGFRDINYATFAKAINRAAWYGHIIPVKDLHSPLFLLSNLMTTGSLSLPSANVITANLKPWAIWEGQMCDTISPALRLSRLDMW